MKIHIKKLTALLLSAACVITTVPQTPEIVFAKNTSTPISSVKGSSVEGNLAVCDNAKYIYNFFITELGLNSAAACGLLANIRKESAFNPKAYSANDGGSGYPSYGLCQWHDTGKNKGRFTNLKKWCDTNSYDYTTLEGQLRFLQHELSQDNNLILYNGQTIYNYLRSVENNADGAYAAGWYWCYYFEVPANRETTAVTRGNFAKDIYWPAYCQPSIDSVTVKKNSVSISWSAFPNASSYELFRYENSDPATAISLSNLTKLSFKDTSLSSGVVYSYFLRTYIPQGDGSVLSADSVPVTAYYLAPPVIKKVVGKENSITTSWSAVNGASSYQIYRNANGGEYSLLAQTSDTSYIDTALSTDIKYRYIIKSVAAFPDGSSAYSKNSYAAACYALSQPQLSSVKVTADGLKLNWNKVSHAKEYIVYRKKGNGSYKAIATVKNNKYIDSKAIKGKTYSYKVKARFVLEDYITSTSKASSAIEKKYQNGPELTSLTSPRKGAITVRWAKVKSVSGYEILYATNSKFSKSKSLIIVGDDSVAWTINNLAKNKTYYAKVRTFTTKNGKKVYSQWSNTRKLKLKK